MKTKLRRVPIKDILPNPFRPSNTPYSEGKIQELIRSFQATNARRKPPIWRLARVWNPNTGRWNRVRVTKDGSLMPADARWRGVEFADQWVVVRAYSWSEAIARIEAGEGSWYERNDDGSVNRIVVEEETRLAK